MDHRVDPGDRGRHGGAVGDRRLDEPVGNAGKVFGPPDRQVIEDADAVAALDEEPRQ
jgi:hypothetical protein